MYDEIDAAFSIIHNEIMNDKNLLSALKDAQKKGALLVTASGNAGDGLIHLGAQALLEKHGISLSKVASSDSLPTKSIAIIVGGAMIEGVWDERIRGLREHLIRGDKVIFLACSLYGFKALLSEFKHQIIVFARDLPTYENATACGIVSYLTHDLAFALPLEFFKEYRPLGNQRLIAYRTDAEAVNTVNLFGNLDLSLLWNGPIWDDFNETERRCKALASVIANYNEIQTDRLHLSILAAVLGLKVNLYGTNGGKTAAVFSNSLNKFPNVAFCADANCGAIYGEDNASELLKYSRELAELRNSWYEPELERRATEISRLQLSIKEVNVKLKQTQLENARLQHRLLTSVGKSTEGKYLSLALTNKPAPNNSFLRSLKLAGYVLFPYNSQRRAYRRAMKAAIWK